MKRKWLYVLSVGVKTPQSFAQNAIVDVAAPAGKSI
jgi:hypothetical protein